MAQKTHEILRSKYTILLSEHKSTKHVVIPKLEKKFEESCKEVESLKKE
jgi:hypothetical protein